MLRLKSISLFILGLLIFSELNATHLVGGSMSYEYLGLQNNGNYRYRVLIKMYRDCRASTVPFDDVIDVGIYNNNANRTIARTLTIPLLTEVPVNPPSGGSNCSFQPDVCLREAIYQGLVDLPSSTLGYHMVFKRCCRNTQQNIVDDMGQTYYAFIPNTSINNSSPFFTEVPAPYICRNDSVSVYHTARDKDGDSLVYQLSTPWTGGSQNDPVPGLPFSMPDIPNFAPVIYRQGYNANIPFGNSGLAQIDQRNGVTTLLSPGIGRYSIAIDVTEFRNGVMLSKVRLDIQMIVINCPPNAVPNITTTNNNQNYSVMEGEEICFTVFGFDPDNHNIELKGFGELFDGVMGSKATFPNANGRGSAQSQFCWTAPCGSARQNPYPATFEVQDDGCPYKKRAVNVNINVTPFIGVNQINGPNLICADVNNVEYVAPGLTSSSYQWTVQGGVIASGQGSGRIRVNWDNVSFGVIEVIEISKGGCQGAPARINVTLLPAPPKPRITGPDTVCTLGSGTYSIPAIANHSYNWSVNGGNIANGQFTNQISVNWGAPKIGFVRLTTTNSAGCTSDPDTFWVQIIENKIERIIGSPSVCPNSRDIEYFVSNPNSESAYFWSVSKGVQSAGGNSSGITINWGEQDNGYLEVYEINKFGCRSNTVRMNVLIDYILQGMMPEGEDTLCELSSGIPYSVPRSNGSLYFWDISGGTLVGNDSTHKVKANWGAAGNAWISVFEQAFDSVNSKICLSTPIALPVFLAPYPTNLPIIGRDELCQSPVPEPYVVNGFTGSTYQWTVNGLNFTGQGASTIAITPDKHGTFLINSIETSRYGCAGPENNKTIIIHPKPTTIGIEGDEIICYPRYQGQAYSVQGFASSNFNWTFDGGSIVSGQGSPQVSLNFNGQADSRITVQEISDFGCPGDTLSLDVFADRPSLDLKVISVNLDNETKMEVSWELVNAPRYNATQIVQRRANGTSWINAGTTGSDGKFFMDAGLNTDDNDYEYRIVGFNLCGDSLFSDIHRQVRITGQRFEDDEYSVTVNWTRYRGWNDGVNNYEVYRKEGRNPYVLQNNAGRDTTDFYADGTQTFQQCYRIKALSNETGIESWSNEICFGFTPILYLPNAFTPNGDDKNDQYSWYYASIKDFSIRIYDRWGELIYEGLQANAFWNGDYRGEPAPEGVYMYMVSYNGFDGRVISLKGNITLLR